MFAHRGQFRTAHAHYRSVDLDSRIEGASPHQLVTIMFEELLKSLDAMAVAIRSGDHAQRSKRQSRSLSILMGLEGSLDFEKGGEIAHGLASIYREARRLTALAVSNGDPQPILNAREMLQEIALAWTEIGQSEARV